MNGSSAETMDKAGRAYWDNAWSHEEFPAAIDPRGVSIWSHRDQVFHREIARLMPKGPVSLLELGCARSAWLPYFSREFGCRVSGLDYSPLGAEQAGIRLEQEGITGDIRCADLFDPPADWPNAFDVVVWFGVAEHFQDTSAAIRAGAAYLKPGGLMITEIPNLAGINGWLQRLVNKPVYDIHVPLTAPALARHHADAGLQVVASRYVVPTDFGVIDLEGIPPGAARTWKDRFLYPLRLLSGVLWWLDRRIGPLPTGRLTSGFIITGARKEASGGMLEASHD